MVTATACNEPLIVQYEAITPLDKAKAGEKLLSGDPEAIVYGLLGAVEGVDDWRWVQDQCLRFVTDPREDVVRAAVICLGHLARIRGKLDQERVGKAFRKVKVGASPRVRGAIEDALSDIKIFLR